MNGSLPPGRGARKNEILLDGIPEDQIGPSDLGVQRNIS